MSPINKFNQLVTVEIITFLFCFTIPIIQFAVQELLYVKLCLQNENTTDSLCHDRNWINKHKETEGKTSLWIMYINIAIVIPAIISSIFQGSYIDKFGFSLPTRLPLVGITIACGVSAIVALTDVRHELLIVGMVFMGACGHTPAFMMAANAYVVKDASGEKNKTLRLAIVGSCLAIGISAGTAVIGPISDHLGLYWVFLIGLFSSLLALLDSVLRVRAPRHQPPVPHGKHFLNKLKETLELRTMKSYIKVMTRSREHSRRLHMHLMTLVFVISFCALIGVVDVEFLYLTKEKGFTTTQASTFMSVAMLLMFFGKTLGTYVLSSKLGLNLIYITMIGSLSAIINYTGFSLANSFAALWASNVFKMFSGLNSVMTRSYVSGCVEMNEQGTIISFMSVTEAMFKLIASFVFNGLYPLTLTTWPGAMFMVAAVLCVSGLPVLGFIRWHELRTGAKYVIMNEDGQVMVDDNSNSKSASNSKSDDIEIQTL